MGVGPNVGVTSKAIGWRRFGASARARAARRALSGLRGGSKEREEKGRKESWREDVRQDARPPHRSPCPATNFNTYIISPIKADDNSPIRRESIGNPTLPQEMKIKRS